MRKRLVSVATLLLLCVATVAAAENRAETFSLTPFVGGYTFDGKQHLDTGPVFGLRAGYNFTDHVGVEGLFDYTMSQGTRDNQNSNIYNYSLNALYHFFPKNRLVPFLTAGYGGMTIDPQGGSSSTKGAFNYGAGVKYALSESMELRGEVRHLLFKTSETLSNVEYGIGLGFLFGGKKPLPPASSLSVMPGSIMKGQSANLSWTSQNVTNCSIQPGIGPVQPQGSMSVSPAADTTYTLDCSGAAGTTSSVVNVSVSTPPPPSPAPTSSLSVTPASITRGESATLSWNAQNATNCDLQPGIGPVKPQGSMSITPSADTAYALACSGPGGSTSSTANVAVVTPPPPPPPAPALLHPEKEETVNLLIEFDHDKSVIKPEFYPVLNEVGEFLQKYPTIDITVEGHTDSLGKNAYNQKLSQRRAEAVKKYIVDKFGIDAKRIKAVGYGETKPIASNKTPEGRYKNRRVQAYHAAAK